MVGMEELGGDDLFLALTDPVVLELNPLHNQVKDKDRELGAAHGEIKGLRTTEALKEKAIEELSKKVDKLDEKLQVTEDLLEQKNLECKKLEDEKKDALAAQFSAEASLRRLYEDQKDDDDSVPISSVLAPLEADIRMYKAEVAGLQEDKKALERLTKSKESALLEAERILKSALERALIVEEVHNQNFELKRQIEICQEENRILDKTNRQKVLEVQKLTQTIEELEEAVLAGGTAANAIRDYRRQITELNDEKRTLERELARIKVSASRVATVAANEWKDDNDKVMPVKQWLEERRLHQAEMVRLRDKLAISERTAKAEAQLKERLKLRLKTLEEGLKHALSFSLNPNAYSGNQKVENPKQILSFLTNNGQGKRSTSQPRASTISRSSSLLHQDKENISATRHMKRTDMFQKSIFPKDNKLRRQLWTFASIVSDSVGKENRNGKSITDGNFDKPSDTAVPKEVKSKVTGDGALIYKGDENEDLVSGFLYDRLQKEVLNLRRFCEIQDRNLKAKDEEIKMLIKKVDALTRSIEVESKKMRREAAREKETMIRGDNGGRNRKTMNARRVTTAS